MRELFGANVAPTTGWYHLGGWDASWSAFKAIIYMLPSWNTKLKREGILDQCTE